MRTVKHLVTHIVFGVLLTSPVAQSKAEIIFQDGWEAGCWNVYEKTHGSTSGQCSRGVAWRRSQMQGPYSGKVVKRPSAREGEFAMKFQWRRSAADGSNTREKAMLHADRAPRPPIERWYGFSCYFPSATTQPDNEEFLFMQMHGTPDHELQEPWRQPLASLDVHRGELSFQYTYDLEQVSPKNTNLARNRKSFDLGTLPRDRWVDFVMHMKYSLTEDGVVDLWMDGAKVVGQEQVNVGYNDRLGPFFSVGVYHGNSKSDHEVTAILMDAVRIGDENSNYQEVKPRAARVPTAPRTGVINDLPNEDQPIDSKSTFRTNVDAEGERSVRNHNIVYPANVQAVVDVTQAPYHLDNTGQKDCTSGLIRAIADVLRDDREAMQVSLRNINASDGPPIHRADELSFTDRQAIRLKQPKAIIGFERCRGIFPYRQPVGRILYFPNGTYRISDTIVYPYTDLQNAIGMELNRCLHFQGQSQQGVIIRLEDHADGFDGDAKPAISFTRGNRSNVAMQNTIENVTIEIGAGNPGAVGLEFFANNTGAVRHVTIRSSDPSHIGAAGLSIAVDNSSGVLVRDLTVNGFDFGVRLVCPRLYTVLEHVRLRHQQRAGMLINDHNVALRGLVSRNDVPALRITGSAATLAVIDSKLMSPGRGDAAIELEGGFLYARDVSVRGYELALSSANGETSPTESIEEYVSHHFSPQIDTGQGSLRLPIEETPQIIWQQDPDEWISVNECGARGDGFTDDTEAIQRACRAGKSVVFFQPGTYVINGTVDVPPSVERLNFMYVDLVAGPNLQDQEARGAFRIVGDCDQPLIVEDLFAFELFFGAHYLVDHASRRTVVLSDLHTQVGALYRNSVSGGRLFIENVCTTDQFEPHKNCLEVRGQQVWARQLNPERAAPEVSNSNSDLWVLGFKTEKSGTAFRTMDGGRSEIIGGIFNICREGAKSQPAIQIGEGSEVSVFASTTDHRRAPPREPYCIIQDLSAGRMKQVGWEHCPSRAEDLIVVPLYSTLR